MEWIYVCKICTDITTSSEKNVDPGFYRSLTDSADIKYFFCEEDGVSELLELRAFSDIKEIALVEHNLESMFSQSAAFLLTDIRRELLKFVESPIDSDK